MKNNVYYEYTFFLFIPMLVLLCSGCDHTPEETVEQYLEYTFKSNEGNKAYSLLTLEDQRYKSEEEFHQELKRRNVFNEKFLRKYKDQFTYEILYKKNIHDDTVKIGVVMSKPNTRDLLEEMIALAMTSSIHKVPSSEKKELLDEHFGRIMESEDLELETEEKEFTLIRENGEYRIFLNFGMPHKRALINQKIEKLNEEAEEKMRTIDFKGAAQLYREMQAMLPGEEIPGMNRLQEMEEKTIQLGEKITCGNLTIQPTMVELKKIKIYKKNWVDDSPKETLSNEKYMVMSLNIFNHGEGEVIDLFEDSRYKRKHVVYDNYGNEMREFLLEFDMMGVEDNRVKRIGPGQKSSIKAICEYPLSPGARQFLWKMKVFKDNKKTEDFIYISFARNQIREEE